MEWNRKNIIRVVLVLVLGFGAGGVIYVHQEGGLGFAMFRLKKWANGLYGGESSMTAKEEIVSKREVERIRKIIFEKYPSLQLEGKEVPAELNGYLALFELAKDPDLQLLMSSEILYQVNEEKIDLALIRKELAAYDALGKEIGRIAALPERSNVIDGKLIDESLPANKVKSMGDYLILQARLVAMDGNEIESFRYLSLAVNLSEHLGQIESPHALSEVVRFGLRYGIRRTFFQQILPAFGKTADLQKWDSILKPQTDSPQHYSHILKGDFNLLTESFFYVMLGGVPDPEQTALAYAKWVVANMSRYDKMSLDQAGISECLPIEPFVKGISREGTSLVKGLIIGSNLLRSMHINVLLEHYQAAAIDLLIREQKGEDTSKLTETFIPNPYTGKPFAYDATMRTLDQVTGAYDLDLEALKLPW